MIISIGTGEASDKVYLFFMIKMLNKLGIEETNLNTINTMFDKPTANIIVNGEMRKYFHLSSGTKHHDTT